MSGTVTGRIAKINQVTRGWINYYAFGSMKTAMTETDAHLRTRLRIIIWKQWKVPKKRQWGSCTAHSLLRRQILLGCHKDMCG